MIRIDRRQLIATSAFGIGGLLMPGGRVGAQLLAAARGFTHDVASGEPDSDSLLLWTRFVGSGDSAHVRAEISETPDFSRIVASNQMITGPWRDWTVKITLDGLRPRTRYHYRFVAPDGAMSVVGRAKTLPQGRTAAFKLAIFSCSNLPYGFFNGYGHAAARDDLDAVVHLGDYFYEYKRGTYPSSIEALRLEQLQPSEEVLRLADYRLRYASYRADPDLAALHRNHAMIASMDDHESANDSWEGGAENHQSGEGDWAIRRAAAYQAYREWMPVSDEPWKSYAFGDLATYFRTDTRLLARSRQPSLKSYLAAADSAAELKAFHDGDWMDPAQTMLGTTQESWLARAMRTSVKAGVRWQVVGMGTVMGQTYMPAAAAGWLAPDAPDYARAYTLGGIAAAKAGLPFNVDNWGGYPAARERFLQNARDAQANLIVVSGDSHNAWAYELERGAGVEFAGHSITSPGYESSTRGVDPATIAAALIGASPELKWADTSRRGYMAMTLTHRSATNEWLFMQTIKTRSLATQRSQVMRVGANHAQLETV